jgi:GAF domain-containing protein
MNAPSKREVILRELRKRARDILAEFPTAEEGLDELCEVLRSAGLDYDWVGFYLVSPVEKNTLFLGPFAGEPTDHVVIPFGSGICGQAAAAGETFVVADVTAESNYLSCSSTVKSEAVIPLFAGGRLVGELDIDSHTPNTFKRMDMEFLTGIAELASNAAAEILAGHDRP